MKSALCTYTSSENLLVKNIDSESDVSFGHR